MYNRKYAYALDKGVAPWNVTKRRIPRNAHARMSPVLERACVANVSVTTGEKTKRRDVCFRRKWKKHLIVH